MSIRTIFPLYHDSVSGNGEMNFHDLNGYSKAVLHIYAYERPASGTSKVEFNLYEMDRDLGHGFMLDMGENTPTTITGTAVTPTVPEVRVPFELLCDEYTLYWTAPASGYGLDIKLIAST